MLKKRDRLTKKEFDEFFKTGARIHHPLFTLVYTPHEDFHAAVVVGKKVSKKAVERNKFRRRIYSALYAISREHELHGIFIILSKPAIKSASFRDIKSNFSEVVGRVRKKG